MVHFRISLAPLNQPERMPSGQLQRPSLLLACLAVQSTRRSVWTRQQRWTRRRPSFWTPLSWTPERLPCSEDGSFEWLPCPAVQISRP